MRSRTFRPQLESLEDRRLLAFVAGGAYSAGNVPHDVVIADFNHDGHNDLATANGWAGTVSVLPGTGNGSFDSPSQVGAYAPQWLKVGDFNGDGNSDLVTKYFDSWGSPESGVVSGYGRVEVHLGRGDGTFQPAQNVHSTDLASQPIPETVLVADVNGDGRSDLGIHGWYSYAIDTPYDPSPPRPEYFTVLLGNADRTFTETYRDPSEFPPSSASDLNGDGYGDKLELGSRLGVRLGRGDGTFGPPESYLEGQSPTAVAVGDFNGDDRPDLGVATYESEDVLVLLNDGNWPSVLPAMPTIIIGDATVTEGNTGTTSAVFIVSLSAAYSQTMIVNFATGEGSASAGSDYQAATGTLTFAPGQTSKSITIPVVGDTTFEPNETFVVHLSGAAGATIADGQGVGTIVNDDVPLPSLNIDDVFKYEGRSGTTAFTFTVRLSAPASVPVSVQYATANGTAKVASGDYYAKSGTLTFQPGQISKTVTVLVRGDRTREADETFFLNLANSQGAWIGDGQGLGMIENDDGSTLASVMNELALLQAGRKRR